MTAFLQHLAWREPLWLGLTLCPWLLWVLRGLLARSRGRDYADPQLLPWARAQGMAGGRAHRYWRHGVVALAWLLFALAMAGPRLAQTEYALDKDQYPQLMVVLDVSRSMTARDVAPSRLERAKLELEDLIAREEHLKIGLVLYAARPHLLTPPTADKTVLRHDLRLVHYGLLPTAGSNLPAAIEFAARQFSANTSPHALLLVTDGEMPTTETSAQAVLRDTVVRLTQQGTRLYALGVGTVEGAPLQGAQGQWLHERGKPVVSRLHARRLQELTVLGNGRYAAVADTDADWQSLYDENIRYLGAATAKHNGARLIEWRELFGWFLVPAVLLLLLAYVQPVRSRASGASPLIVLAVMAVLGTLVPSPAQASAEPWLQRAYQAYGRQAYREAQRDYARVAGYAGRMGEGSSAYRLGDYPQAISLFTQAILDADSDGQRARAVFNLANSHYRLGEYGVAASLYREALRYAPNDKAAQSNLAFATAKQKKPQTAEETAAAGPPGRGPRSAVMPQGTSVGHGKLSLGDKTKPGLLPSLPGSPIPAGDIIERGIYQSQPVVQQAGEFKDPQWHYAPITPENIVSQADALKVDERVLWKRIFEAEEGFPAPVDTPRALPGVRPW